VTDVRRLLSRMDASSRVIESSARFVERMLEFALADPETAGAVMTTATAMLDRAMLEGTAGETLRAFNEAGYSATTASAEEADAIDLAEARAAMERIELGEEVPIPHDVAMRVVEGESAVKAYRERLGMNQAELAAAAGLTQGALSDIERGRRKPGLNAAKALAKVLGVPAANLLDLN
jgi:mRNA interferase RelE/StbE